MKIGFVFDTRFKKYKDDYYSVNLSSETLSERYLSVFDEMVVVCRYDELRETPEGKLVKCNTDKIRFKAIKNESPIKRLLHLHRDNMEIEKAINDCDAVICRGWRGISACRKLNKPYLVEVVNCAWDSYWNHGFLGKVVAPIMFTLRRWSTKNAPFVQYVTNEFLQRRYPTNGKSIGVSDVKLTDIDSFDVLEHRLDKIKSMHPEEKIVIGTAGAVDVPFKGQRFVIKALGKLKKQGFTNFEYQIAGGGDNTRLMKIARKFDVEDQIVFKGSIVHDEMFAWFDSLDIYIQPSLQEGLPRALIEAMSRGLPCYGSKTGGIPELLDNSCVCRNNHKMGDKLAYFLKQYNKEFALKMANRNHKKSKEFSSVELERRWQDFLMEFAKSILGE